MMPKIAALALVHLIAFLFCAIAGALPNAGADRAGQPNIILFLVDDLGQRDLSCNGSDFYETPAIDRLAAEGMFFNQAFAAHPRCVPSRYATQTGRFPARAGSGSPKRYFSMPLDEVTVAEALRDGGYGTYFLGKWHLSNPDESTPENQGYDVNIAGGHAGAPISYHFPYNKLRAEGHKTEKPIEGLDEGEEGEYLTDRLTDEAVKLLRRHHSETPDKPFFMMLSHYGVHTPLEARAELAAKYEKKLRELPEAGGPGFEIRDGRTKLRQDDPVYAAMIESVDQSLDRIRKTLKKLGLGDDTIIIFSSDHGGLSNSGADSLRPLATTNLPLRAGKGHLYEGGVRIPLIVHWPGVTDAGSRADSIAVNTDFFPTMLEMAGLPPRPDAHLDGQSLVPALEGEDQERAAPVIWYNPNPRPASTGDTASAAIRDGDWKFLRWFWDDTHALYNIADDPGETTDLAGQHPEIAARLLDRLEKWLDSIEPFPPKPQE